MVQSTALLESRRAFLLSELCQYCRVKPDVHEVSVSQLNSVTASARHSWFRRSVNKFLDFWSDSGLLLTELGILRQSEGIRSGEGEKRVRVLEP